MYIPQTPPYKHQAEAFRRSETARAYAYTMEQRTGKSKVTIDVAAAAFERGTINGLLIVAPKGVDTQWVQDEIPMHLPQRIGVGVVVYRSNKTGNKSFQQVFSSLLAHSGLAVMAINYEAFATPKGREHAERFLRARKTMMVADESSFVKTPGAARTKAITRLGKLAVARRILDGTPNAENPLELFAQYRFLDPDILGYTSFYAFRSRYAILEQGFDPRSGRRFDKVTGYAHLEELQKAISPYTFRVRRDDVFDMPAKVYQKVRYELSPEQRRVYDSIRETYRAELKSGEQITAPNILARYLRCQQVLSNRLPSADIKLCPACKGAGCQTCNDEGIVHGTQTLTQIDSFKNPRLDALKQILQSEPVPTIVWTRFRHEADEVIALGQGLRIPSCRYDGSTCDADRLTARQGFQDGAFRLFVGSPAAAGRGLTLSAAKLIVYYSNYFSLRVRLQSEDRAEAPGKSTGTGVIDIIAEDTIDEKIVEALRAKRSLSDAIMGDPKKVWI